MKFVNDPFPFIYAKLNTFGTPLLIYSYERTNSEAPVPRATSINSSKKSFSIRACNAAR